MAKRRYLHIGCPKTLSTTLQRDFFDAHPALYHLGVGRGGNVDYRDADLELAVEGHLLFCKELLYRPKEPALRAHLAAHFAAAEEDPAIGAVGLSNESLCFGYTPGHVDTAEKARRLRELFGPGTEVLLILRNQPDLLTSLYRESIRNGYPGTLADFLTYAYLHQDRSFLGDFLFDRTVAFYGDLFGPDHVHVLPLEDYRLDGRLIAGEPGHTVLTDRLAAILDIEARPVDLARHNATLPDDVLEAKRRLNAAAPHDLGHGLLGGVVNGHRLRQVYARELEWDASAWLYDDVKQKRASLARAEDLAQQETLTLDLSVPQDLRERLERLFCRSNRRLAELLRTELPAAYRRPSFKTASLATRPVAPARPSASRPNPAPPAKVR